MPTAWDLRAGGGALALGALLFALACLLTGATDEGSVRWATRAARTLPIVPLCGAAVTWLALARARRRGELLALESIGASPARASAFVVAAAALLGLAAATCVLAFRGATLDAFFPRATARDDVVVAGDGFADLSRGVRIGPDGALARQVPAQSQTARPAPAGRAASAAALVALLGLALPLVAARAARGGDGRHLALAGAMCVLCMLLMQAAAAGRGPPELACVPAAALLIVAAVRYRSPAW
ncbi:MAG TPA: hypothetical protein VGH28_20785 [Polyangiaceae bacterium]|jgi:hypothetical protein